jgi:ketol-acid reductoisomerase
MSTRIYHDEDADLGVLDDRAVAVLGYGNQGRAQAQNLRHCGVGVVVGIAATGLLEQLRTRSRTSQYGQLRKLAGAGELVATLRSRFAGAEEQCG